MFSHDLGRLDQFGKPSANGRYLREAVIVNRDLGRRSRSRTRGSHRGCFVMPEHSRQALPKEKEEAGCADNQPDPTHLVSDER